MLGFTRKKRRDQRVHGKIRCRLEVEALEQRAVPATIRLAGAGRFQDVGTTSLVYSGGNNYTALNLRSAIIGANNLGGPDTIVLETGTYTMDGSAGQFLVSDPSGTLTILNGAGGVSTIDAQGQTRVFLNQSGLSLSGLKIEHGLASDRGGAIFNNGTLDITNCQFVHNEAIGSYDGAPVQGGAIFTNADRILNVRNTSFTGNVALGGTSSFFLGGTGTASGGALFFGGGAGVYADNIVASTFVSNQAIGGAATVFDGFGARGGVGAGGGIFAEAGNYDLNVINATFAANVAQGGQGALNDGGAAAGGGLYLQSGQLGTIRLVNDTIAQNVANGGQGSGALASPGLGSGGGLADNFVDNFLGLPVAKVINTIVAKNAANFNNDVDGVFASLGSNLIGAVGSAAGFSAATGDFVGTTRAPLDPGLDPLGNYGGPTQTFRPGVSSFVIDRGTNSVVTGPLGLTTDQRGHARRSGSAVDIGAYEVIIAGQSKAYTLSQGALLTTTGLNGLLAGYHNPLHKAVTVQLVARTGPATGVLALHGNGSFIYAPPKSFHGAVSFQFRILVDGEQVDIFTATITVSKPALRLKPKSLSMFNTFANATYSWDFLLHQRLGRLSQSPLARPSWSTFLL